MPRKYLEAYKDTGIGGLERRLYLHTGNPNKFLALQYLIHKHE
jgi:hypothetical protein